MYALCSWIDCFFFCSIQMVCLYRKSSSFPLNFSHTLKMYVYSVFFTFSVVNQSNILLQWMVIINYMMGYAFDLDFLSSSFDWFQKGMFSLLFCFDVYHIRTISIRLTYISRVDNDNEDKIRQALNNRHHFRTKKNDSFRPQSKYMFNNERWMPHIEQQRWIEMLFVFCIH